MQLFKEGGTMSGILRRIKGWMKFQHYQSGPHAKKHPDWIKLYRSLLDDIEWHELDPIAAKTLVSLWLLASENGGTLPPVKTIAFRLRMTEKQINSVLSQLPHWLEGPDQECLDGPAKVSRPEEEREEEENKKEKENKITPEPNGSVSDEQIAFDSYNEAAARLNLPLAEKLTSQRRTSLRARLKDHGLEGWFRALANLEQLPFCLGQGERGWRANLDFLLQPSSFQKVLEKAFAGGTGPPPKQSRTVVELDAFVDEVRRQNGTGYPRIRGERGEHAHPQLSDATERSKDLCEPTDGTVHRKAASGVTGDG
jgi:hypothetical protein